MTYIQEIELLLQTAEKIDEEMQHSSSQQLFLILLGVGHLTKEIYAVRINRLKS